MRKIYLIIFMILFSAFNAQIVNIPDPLFKAKLVSASTAQNFHFATNSSGQYIKIDTNNNGEIEVSEANAVWGLTISDSFITDITGIQSFSNLNNLKLFGFDAQTVDVSSMTSLNYLIIQALDQLTGINIANCTNLQNIDISGGNSLHSLTLVSPSVKNIKLFGIDLTQLDITGCPALKNLMVQATDIPALDLSNLTQLTDVTLLSNSFLQNVNFQGCTSLYRASVVGSSMTSFTIANLPALWKIECSSNPALQTLNISNCPALERIQAGNNSNLSALNLSNLPNVLILDIIYNKFTSLDLSALPALGYLRCEHNQLQSLDFSHNPNIGQIDCQYNNIKSINLKNGSSNFPPNLPFLYNQLQFLCCDDEDVAYAITELSGWGINNVVVNTYCSFTPGGTFYTIQGNTKYDNNNNGCDSNDLNKTFQHFNITNGTVSGNIIADNSGNHSIAVGAGSHIITPALENPAYFNISPASVTADFPAQVSPLIQNFCMSANGTHNDLEVVIIPITAASPGFEAKYKIIYKNKGTNSQSGTIVFNYNDNLMNYLSSTLAPNSQSTGALNWNFTNFLPFETKEITVSFTLNTPTQTPPLNGGDILHYTTQITGTADETPADNTFTLNQTVVNSFDPNDKTCLEGASITQAQVGDYVHYLIRFENTGTANAQNIVVKDIIDTSKFDIATLRPLSGSHNFMTRITDPNVVEFIFENIQLPFDNANNDGYISFKIKTKSTLTIGDSFSNKANIYFDYNAPIITNTYTTSVQNVLSTSEADHTRNAVSIYPNPVKDELFFQSKNEILKAEIYDASGRIVMTAGVKNNSIQVSGLTKGNYTIKLATKDKTITQKFIKN